MTERLEQCPAQVSDLRGHALDLSLITSRAGKNSRSITPPSVQTPKGCKAPIIQPAFNRELISPSRHDPRVARQPLNRKAARSDHLGERGCSTPTVPACWPEPPRQISSRHPACVDHPDAGSQCVAGEESSRQSRGPTSRMEAAAASSFQPPTAPRRALRHRPEAALGRARWTRSLQVQKRMRHPWSGWRSLVLDKSERGSGGVIRCLSPSSRGLVRTGGHRMPGVSRCSPFQAAQNGAFGPVDSSEPVEPSEHRSAATNFGHGDPSLRRRTRSRFGSSDSIPRCVIWAGMAVRISRPSGGSSSLRGPRTPGSGRMKRLRTTSDCSHLLHSSPDAAVFTQVISTPFVLAGDGGCHSWCRTDRGGRDGEFRRSRNRTGAFATRAELLARPASSACFLWSSRGTEDRSETR